jgi:hypothetical protein
MYFKISILKKKKKKSLIVNTLGQAKLKKKHLIMTIIGNFYGVMP